MEVIDLDKAKALVKAAVEKYPERKNPRDKDINLCLYTAQDDPEWHCIAGQLIADAGGNCPPASLFAGFDSLVAPEEEDDDGFDIGLEFTPDAAMWLNDVQKVFDGVVELVTHDGEGDYILLPSSAGCRVWSEALELVEEHLG